MLGIVDLLIVGVGVGEIRGNVDVAMRLSCFDEMS
jgi:hypothetical protein